MTTLAEPHLMLEDVARDGFRRKFFLSAFGDETDALELCFAFLGHVRKYKTLVGRKELLRNIVCLYYFALLPVHCVAGLC